MLTVKMSTVIMSTVDIFFASHRNLHFDKAVDILTHESRHFNMKVGIMIDNIFLKCRYESRHYDLK